MESKFLHYTDDLLTFDDIINKEQTNCTFKPIGLWFSIGNAWVKWCIEAGFSTCDIETCNIYEAELNLEKIYLVDSFDKLKELHSNYYLDTNERIINWIKLAKEYDGIMFTNYANIKKYILENNMLGMYTWFMCVDVESVCIWNKNALKSFNNFFIYPN